MLRTSLLLLALHASAASAECYGIEGYQTCTDASGNTYAISRYGRSTHMQGFNANTGSVWSQSTTSLGGQTLQNGFAADGTPWQIIPLPDTGLGAVARPGCGILGCF